MNLERLQLLEQFAREDPADPFYTYALALEWAKTDIARALKLFDTLLSLHPDYIPVYYQAGHISISLGDFPKAKRILETGIQKTRDLGDLKTRAELESLYEELD